MVKKQIFGTGFSEITKLKILRRDNYTCIYCGRLGAVVDHVIPRSKGGITTKANGVACCTSCNMKKKGNLDLPYITRGLFYLSTVGENTSWVDKLTDSIVLHEKYTEITEPCPDISMLQNNVRIMLRHDLSHSEISYFLDVSIVTVEKIAGELRKLEGVI